MQLQLNQNSLTINIQLLQYVRNIIIAISPSWICHFRNKGIDGVQCFLKLRFVLIQGESVSENNQCLGGDLELRGHQMVSALLLHPGLRPQVLTRIKPRQCL